METALKIRNILFKAFIINYALVIFVWLLFLVGVYQPVMERFFGFDEFTTNNYVAYLLGFWKILVVVFFLVPAFAIHLEYGSKKAKRKKLF